MFVANLLGGQREDRREISLLSDASANTSRCVRFRRGLSCGCVTATCFLTASVSVMYLFHSHTSHVENDTVGRGKTEHDPGDVFLAASSSGVDEDSPLSQTRFNPTWYYMCKTRGPCCDMRMNIKTQVDLESQWAWYFLKHLPQNTTDLFIEYLQKMHDHFMRTNEKRGTHCPTIEPIHEYLKYVRARGFSDVRMGRVIANYISSLHVKFKVASDAVRESPADSNSSWGCAWRAKQPGFGTDMMNLDRAIKGSNGTDKFMWTQEKGRGTSLDLAALTMGVERNVVTEAMGRTFRAIWKQNRGEKEYYEAMPADDQRMLPGRIRWEQTFRSNDFGLFSYGDKPEWSDATREYFFEDIVHGMGIHGRNLSWGSPADRMLMTGLPWIGGVSGSHIDFYLSARDLGYEGRELADIMLVDIACLVAGGQHSLGELLFAAAEAEMEDSGRPRFRHGDDDSFTYFATASFSRLVRILNKAKPAFRVAVQELADKGTSLPALYEEALEEFFRRSSTHVVTRPAVAAILRHSVQPQRAQTLRPCLTLPAVSWFREAVYAAGGPKRAFSDWTNDGATAWLVGLSAVEFITHVGARMVSQEIIYCEVAFADIAAGKTTLTMQDMEDYTKRGTSSKSVVLLSLLRALMPRMVKRLWGAQVDGRKAITETDFSLAFKDALNGIISDVYLCVVKSDSTTGESTMSYDVFKDFYSMVWKV